MKLKKMSVKAPGAEGDAPMAGGPAIADRFRLDPVEKGSQKSSGTTDKKQAMAALIVGCIALVISIVLAVTIFKHWDYLMKA